MRPLEQPDCHMQPLIGTAPQIHSSSWLWTLLMSFLFQRLVEDRVRVHIPGSVQTHKTLTSSPCRLTAGVQGSFQPSHKRVKDQHLIFLSGMNHLWRHKTVETKSVSHNCLMQCSFAVNWRSFISFLIKRGYMVPVKTFLACKKNVNFSDRLSWLHLKNEAKCETTVEVNLTNVTTYCKAATLLFLWS